jgi:branched-subunit amino acid aminotransferase/4-amino-4-deoxychorismate lyase
MAVFLDDRFVEDHEALLHVSDLSMQRGYAVFDFFRTVNGVPLFLNDHFDRLYASAEAMHLPMKKSRVELSVIIRELIKRSALTEAGIRIMLTGGESSDSYHPAEPNLLISCNPLKTATQADFEKGYSVITHEYQRELPHVKSINYLMAVWLQPMLKEKQADDILYYNKESITEFPRSNVFIITADNKLVTPANKILKGITRKNILLLAADILPVEERDISIDELINANEVFLTSTSKRIMPIIKADNKTFGSGKPGVVTTMLYHKFLELERSATHLESR